MYNERPHSLLAQVPLTVSPFVSLPTATTLPYTYKTLPSTLPPSTTTPPASRSNETDSKSPFVVSSTGHAAHPDDIIASCRALQDHLETTRLEATRTLEKWKQEISERELAEKRRIAPGWLDREEKILEPERAIAPVAGSLLDESVAGAAEAEVENGPLGLKGGDEAGRELDRAFGGMALR